MYFSETLILVILFSFLVSVDQLLTALTDGCNGTKLQHK